ncbi:toll/interleukin-1 receptor domain-containing protein [Oricola sp.]|uniref:toll/interleukin-1 receptor domain-containing protein n=1 Tax=Oricola sp. TaxID=1979950 RepID=UPI003BAB84F4
MKVFLSYSSDDAAEADLVASSIRARGNRVFFDKTDLPPGQSYEDQIEAAINEASVFVFLISPSSISAGRFTLTELGIARKKWPSAKGNVLPVLIRPAPIEDVPPYLRSVTILTPEGNIAAETAAAVRQLRWHSGRLMRRAAAAAMGAVALGSAVWYFTPPIPNFSVDMGTPIAWQRGFFGGVDTYNIPFEAINEGDAGGQITNSNLEVDPPSALVRHSPEAGEPQMVAPGANYAGHILVSVNDPSARLRVCINIAETGQSCSDWSDWEHKGDFLYGDAFDVGDDLRNTATAVASVENAFIVAAASPKKVVRMTENGTRLAEIALPGAPVSISSGPLGLFIGLTAPNAIAKLDPSSLSIIATTPVSFPKDASPWGEPVSNRPVSIAQDGERLWVLTRGGASTEGLGYFDGNLSAFRVPPFYEDVSFDLSDMRLRNGTGAVWSGRSGTTPASVHRFEPDSHTGYGGHDYDIASCASDVVEALEALLLLPDCEGVVWQVAVNGDRLNQLDRIDSLLGYQSTGDSWEEVLIGKTSTDRYIGVLTQRVSGPSVTPEAHTITASTLNWSSGPKLIFDLDDARVLDLAGGSSSFLLLLESDSDRHQLVAPSYQ